MARELERIDGAQHAAMATRDVIRCSRPPTGSATQLGAAWQAGEWWESCDWGLKRFRRRRFEFGSDVPGGR